MNYNLFLICTLLLFFNPHPSAGQEAETGSAGHATFTAWSAYRSTRIQLPVPAQDRLNKHPVFHSFDVLDARPDTGRIGVHMDRKELNGQFHHKQLVFTHPASQEIARYLNEHYSGVPATYAALIVLRTCWLSDIKYTLRQVEENPDLRFKKTRVRFKAEVYAVREGIYTPVLRFDTTLVSTRTPSGEGGTILAGMLEDMVYRASQVNISRKEQVRQLSLENIRAFNHSRFSHAISRDSSLVKGVYRNFEEFKNNTPGIRDYEMRREGNNALLYLKEGGENAYYTHKVWGVCDGKRIYVMLDGTLCPAWKEQEAYYISYLAPGHVFSVDMDNGSVY